MFSGIRGFDSVFGVHSCWEYNINYINIWIIVLSITTTILLQILSNLANDYGDGLKGTDNENRVGPARAIQSKKITLRAMRNALIINSILALASGIFLIYVALNSASWNEILGFLLLGVFAIISAITYTVGKNAYGYSGLGDLFVFIFFGPVGVIGTYYLATKQIDFLPVLGSLFTGLLSVAVLNMNNMRDVENDKVSNKNTLVVKMGFQSAKKYHFTLIIGGLISFALINYLMITIGGKYLGIVSLIISIPLFKNFRFVAQNNEPKKLDPELKKIALSTFVGSLLLLLYLI